MAEEKNPTLKKAREEITYLTGDEAVKRMEFLHEKWEMDWASGMSHAKKEGRKEDAKKMLEKGMDIGSIVEITELSREEIEELKREIEKDNS